MWKTEGYNLNGLPQTIDTDFDKDAHGLDPQVRVGAAWALPD